MSILSIDIGVMYEIQRVTRAKTEPEAVIKACEWILDYKKREREIKREKLNSKRKS